jgi:hypothetical protein
MPFDIRKKPSVDIEGRYQKFDGSNEYYDNPHVVGIGDRQTESQGKGVIVPSLLKALDRYKLLFDSTTFCFFAH